MSQMGEPVVGPLAKVLSNTAFSSRIDALRASSYYRYEPWPMMQDAPGADSNCIGDPGSALFRLLHLGEPADHAAFEESLARTLRDADLMADGAQPGRWELTAVAGVIAARDRRSFGSNVYIGEDGIRFLPTILESAPSGKALDVGCGTGLLSCALARTCDHVTAIDVVQECLEATRLSAALNGVADRVEPVEAALENYTPSERFDCIVANLPGVPVPPGLQYSPEGNGGPDGLTHMRALLHRAPGLLDRRRGTLLMRFQSLGDSAGPLLLRDLRELAVQHSWDIKVVTDSRLPSSVRAAHTAIYAHEQDSARSLHDTLSATDAHMVELAMSSYYASTLVATTSGQGRVTYVDLSAPEILDNKVTAAMSARRIAERRQELLFLYYGAAQNMPDGFWELAQQSHVWLVAERIDTITGLLADGPITVRDLAHMVFEDWFSADGLRSRWFYVTTELLVNTMATLGIVTLDPAPADKGV